MMCMSYILSIVMKISLRVIAAKFSSPLVQPE